MKHHKTTALDGWPFLVLAFVFIVVAAIMWR